MNLRRSFNEELERGRLLLKYSDSGSAQEREKLLGKLDASVGFAINDLVHSCTFTDEEKIMLRKVKRAWDQEKIDPLYTAIENYLDEVGYLG